MQECAEGGRGPLQGDDEGGATEVFVCEIQEGNDAKIDCSAIEKKEIFESINAAPFPQADGLGALSVDVQCLGMVRQLENGTVKRVVHLGRRDDDALCKRKD